MKAASSSAPRVLVADDQEHVREAALINRLSSHLGGQRFQGQIAQAGC